MKEKKIYSELIEAKSTPFYLNFSSLSNYKDLLFMFIKKDFVATYKQTLLGPLWFFIQPILSTLIFTIVFGKFANLKTDIEPKFLFYLSGIVIWNYFQECFIKTSTVFKDNALLFGKVFFPRIIIPLSIIISNLLKFFIQFTLFIVLIFVYINKGFKIEPNISILLVPFLILLMASLALACGLIITSLTTKYRDLTFVVSFGVQLLMYASPIIYSTNSINSKYANILKLNPLCSIIESFKYAFLGVGKIEYYYLLYSFCFTFILLIFSFFIFQKTEQTFIDTV